tara:strand:- start:498 stop:614 length:117 start_codon:yes stop_codon:yes gene_type:complete
MEEGDVKLPSRLVVEGFGRIGVEEERTQQNMYAVSANR